jgi:hypothetical protein
VTENDDFIIEVFTERGPDTDDDDDDDDDDDGPDGCGVCGGPGPLRVFRLDPSAQPGGAWAIASTWHICSDCLGAIGVANAEALKDRLRPEDRTAPYVDVLVGGLLAGIHPGR